MERCPMNCRTGRRKGSSGVKPGFFRRVSEVKLQPPEYQFFERLLVAFCAWVCSKPGSLKEGGYALVVRLPATVGGGKLSDVVWCPSRRR